MGTRLSTCSDDPIALDVISLSSGPLPSRISYPLQASARHPNTGYLGGISHAAIVVQLYPSIVDAHLA